MAADRGRSVGASGLIAGLLAVAIGALAACSDTTRTPAPAARPHNVILVVFDTTRFDDWSMFSPEREVTPVLDRLGAEGVRFENAWSLYSVTVPSHVSLFTGAAAYAAMGMGTSADGEVIDYRGASIFTLLSERGYRTYAFSGNDNMRVDQVEAMQDVDVSLDRRGPPDGVAYWRSVIEHHGEVKTPEEMQSSRVWHEQRRSRRIIVNHAEHVSATALDAMRDHAENFSDRPYLLFLNYNDAHDPYFPMPPYDTRFPSPEDSTFNGNLWNPKQRDLERKMSGLKLSMISEGLSQADIERARALHLGELAYADAQFGAFLEALDELGLMRDTVIVAAADHGEAFGEAGRMAHSGYEPGELERALLHVPLLMRFPESVPGGQVIDARIDLRDVKPTLLAYLGIDDSGSEGRNLLPLLRGEATGLPAAAIRPQDRSASEVGNNLITGQRPQTREKLESELRELGYIE